MQATNHLPATGKTERTTLAQVSERDCLARISAREAEIEALDNDLLRLNDTLHGSYAASGIVSPAEVGDLGELIERTHRRRRTTHDARRKACWLPNRVSSPKFGSRSKPRLCGRCARSSIR